MSGRGAGSHNGTHKASGEVAHSSMKQKQEQEKEQFGAYAGNVSIPAGVRKVVQRLKEVLNNVSESEIYAVLKDCNMDPNETVNRILSQDTFHEVKSKRDKKKENKDTYDAKSRNSSTSAHRPGRGSLERNPRVASSQLPPNELAPQGKPLLKKDNGTSTGTQGNPTSRRLPVSCDNGSSEKLSHSVPGDLGSSSSSQPSGIHPVWSGVPGQVSMADIVKMGRAQTKPSAPPPLVSISSSSDDVAPPKNSDSKWNSDDNDWPSIEPPQAPTAPEIHSKDHYVDSPSPKETPQPAEQILFKSHDSVQEDDYMNHYENGENGVAANIQQLNINNEQREIFEEDKPSVIIPNHLQVPAQDCSHLSFGSFGSAITSNISGSLPLKSKIEETSVDVPDVRNSTYYEDDQVRNSTEKDNYDSQSAQQEVLKEETQTPEASQPNEYPFTYENTDQTSQISSQMPNSALFSNAYSTPLPSSLLHSGKEAHLSYSQFPVTQAMQNKFTAMNGPNLSMSEAFRGANISAAQPTQQTLASANPATGPALLQQLALHPFSQPTLPLGHFANMISYPFVPQSYTYMPSAFQQTFPANSTYHQSLAAMLPQYKNSVSVSSLPQPAAVAPGYGSTTNFQPTVPAGTNLSYEDLLNSQYKEANHLLSLQQNENSAMWVQGANSRSLSGVPGNNYYNFQGQNQQATTGVRQAQQSTQQFGGLGYQNYYQAALSLEHQQQNGREGQMVNSQGQSSKQTQQMWQSSY